MNLEKYIFTSWLNRTHDIWYFALVVKTWLILLGPTYSIIVQNYFKIKPKDEWILKQNNIPPHKHLKWLLHLTEKSVFLIMKILNFGINLVVCCQFFSWISPTSQSGTLFTNLTRMSPTSKFGTPFPTLIWDWPTIYNLAKNLSQ